MAKHDSIKIGDKFGMWTVTGESFKTGKARNYLRLFPCKCACGAEKEVPVFDLVDGISTCCGCVRRGARGHEFVVGEKIGYWTVIAAPTFEKHQGRRSPEQMLQLRCVCGVEVKRKAHQFTKTISANNKRRENPSCGCMTGPKLATEEAKRDSKIRHKMYQLWHGMKRRCSDQNNDSWDHYGAKGIKVCDEWLDFENYKAWSLSHGYSYGLSLDRIDPDKNYCPENCEWVTKEENSIRVGKVRQAKFAALKTENEQLKVKVHELEMRVSALEGHQIIEQEKSDNFGFDKNSVT